jgi:hypothetical protein
MVDEEPGVAAATERAPDLGWHPVGANPKDPGWYPSGVNPNDQAYWDGQSWTGRRQWTVTGWVEEGAAVAAAGAHAAPAHASPAHAAPAHASPRLSANPYAPPAHTKPTASPATVSVGLLLMMASAITLMYGSVGSWIRLSGSVGILGLHLNVDGIDAAISSLISVNGYVTFIGGIVLLVFAGLALTNDDILLAILTAVVAAATLVFAVYDMFRIVQKISQVSTSPGSSVSVGWGLIAVLSAAVVAMVVALLRLVSR